MIRPQDGGGALIDRRKGDEGRGVKRKFGNRTDVLAVAPRVASLLLPEP